MGNTGYKSFASLNLYYTDDNSYTGVTKPNSVTDPDYIAPVLDTATCDPSARYYNELQALDAIKNNCSSGEFGDVITLVANPGQFVSAVSVTDANNQAITWLNANAQIYANNAGTCTLTGNKFISTWKTDNSVYAEDASEVNQIKLPLVSTGAYNMTVDWGDGTTNTITAYNSPNAIHTYATAGTYTISITGICRGWVFNAAGDAEKILSVSQWGSLRLGKTEGHYFAGCSNLDLSAVNDVLNLAGTANLSYCFDGCYDELASINRISEWNTSKVTDMSHMFSGARAFDGDLGSWNVSNVTDMSYMFAFGTEDDAEFNNGGSSSINNWNVSKVKNMSNMFHETENFNQPIGNWDTSKVTDMSSMFYKAFNFNQDIGSWNVYQVIDMSFMFYRANKFNQDIGSWNISNVTNFSSFMAETDGVMLSSTNLDAIYNGWSTRAVHPSISISFDNTNYTSASVSGRAILTGSPNNWDITDGGII